MIVRKSNNQHHAVVVLDKPTITLLLLFSLTHFLSLLACIFFLRTRSGLADGHIEKNIYMQQSRSKLKLEHVEQGISTFSFKLKRAAWHAMIYPRSCVVNDKAFLPPLSLHFILMGNVYTLFWESRKDD
jgi:hypothetical protein